MVLMSKVAKSLNGLTMAPFEPHEASALQALWAGTADAHQQKIALTWILEGACGIHEISFSPKDGRITDFNEGRRFVGKQIAEILRTNVTLLVEKLRRKDV